MQQLVWPLKREPTMQDREWPGFASAPTEAQQTALGLWRFTDEHGRRPLDLERLAVELHSAGLMAAASLEEAVAVLELHVLQLEECGFLSTYVVHDQEWVSLHRPLRLASSTLPSTPGFTGIDSTALEREKRERARASARARVEEIEQANRGSWERLRSHEGPARPPETPLELLAPPLGCPDHPDGADTPCGPCGTAAERRRVFFAKERYASALADWEFWHGEQEDAGDDDKPF